LNGAYHNPVVAERRIYLSSSILCYDQKRQKYVYVVNICMIILPISSFRQSLNKIFFFVRCKFWTFGRIRRLYNAVYRIAKMRSLSVKGVTCEKYNINNRIMIKVKFSMFCLFVFVFAWPTWVYYYANKELLYYKIWTVQTLKLN
jgi:hypothetical protein